MKSEQPPQGEAGHYESKEEIRYPPYFQHGQSQQDQKFDSQLPLDPYLICPRCKNQFREGQVPE